MLSVFGCKCRNVDLQADGAEPTTMSTTVSRRLPRLTTDGFDETLLLKVGDDSVLVNCLIAAGGIA